MSFYPIYKKRDWIPDLELLDWKILSANPNAITELQKHNMLDIFEVSSNPGAILELEKNLNNIESVMLSLNPAASHLFKNFDKLYSWENTEYNIDYRYDSYVAQPLHRYGLLRRSGVLSYEALALNPQGLEYLSNLIDINTTTDKNIISNLCWNTRAIKWLEIVESRDPDLLDFDTLVNNPEPGAIEIIRRNITKITKESQWNALSFNIGAVSLMKEHFDNISWDDMSQNHSDDAIKLLKENPEKINWNLLSSNENIKAIQMLKENPEKINYYYLSQNPSAIDLLEEYVKKYAYKNSNIDFKRLSINSAIFTLDKEAMQKQINEKISIVKNDITIHKSFVEELTEKALHPDKFKKHLNKYNYDLIEDTYVNENI